MLVSILHFLIPYLIFYIFYQLFLLYCKNQICYQLPIHIQWKIQDHYDVLAIYLLQ